MKEITSLREIQVIEQNILDYVVELCDTNKIRYFLAGGTLLGAVRHRGFIPWDNDIDIAMPRPDYQHFIDIFENTIENPRYKLLRVRDNKNYCYPFVKIVDTRTIMFESYKGKRIDDLGIYIDIFPIDGLGDDYRNAVKVLRKVRRLTDRIAISAIPIKGYCGLKKLKQLIKILLYRGTSREKRIHGVEQKNLIYQFDDSVYVASTYGLRGINEILEQKCFNDYIPIEFNGSFYKAPIGYDKYLKKMYGDYMRLPPVDQQKPPHINNAFWRE